MFSCMYMLGAGRERICQPSPRVPLRATCYSGPQVGLGSLQVLPVTAADVGEGPGKQCFANSHGVNPPAIANIIGFL